MSLINDALRRAKQTQPATSTAAGPALRHVEYSRSMNGAGLLLPALLVAVLIIATLLLWQWFHSPLEVRAKNIPAVAVVAPAKAKLSAPVTASVNAVAVTTPTVAVTTVSSSPVAATSNAVPAVATVEPAKPQPPIYKLQSIFYRPKSPSAVINGKTLYLGDRVGDMRVVSIDQESAVLVSTAGQTNLLELP